MNFDMLPDYSMTLFLSVIICMLVILAAEFTKLCFDSVGVCDEERNAALLQEPPVDITNVNTPTATKYEDLTCNYPSPVAPFDALNEAISEVSDTSDSSYYPNSPNPEDSNSEDILNFDSVWVRRRRRPRLTRIEVPAWA